MTALYIQSIKSPSVQILPANTTVPVVAYTAGSNGSIIRDIIANNSDTSSPYVLTLSLTTNSVTYPLASINVPLSSGNTNAAPAVSLLNDTNLPTSNDGMGNQVIYLAPGTILNVNTETTMASGKAMTITVMGADY